MKEYTGNTVVTVLLLLLLIQCCGTEKKFGKKDGLEENDAIKSYHDIQNKYDVKKQVYLPKYPSIITARKRGTAILTALLPSLVIVSVGTSLIMSCNTFTPNLQKYIEDAKAISKKNSIKRAKINLKWNKVISVKNHLKKMNASLHVLESQMKLLYTLEEDTIVLLEPDVFKKIETKLREIKKTITNNNQTVIDIDKIKKDIGSPSTLGASATASAIVAFSGYAYIKLAVRMELKAIQRRQIARWVRKSPSAFKNKQFNSRVAKIHGASYQKYMVRTAPKYPMVEKRIKFNKDSIKIKKMVKQVKLAGAAIVALSLTVTQFAVMITHYIKCRDKEKYALKILTKVENMKQNLQILSQNITTVELEIKKNYQHLSMRLQEQSFYDFVNNAYEISKNAKNDCPQMKNAERHILFFKIQMRMINFVTDEHIDYKIVSKAVKRLSIGITLVNQFMDCSTARLKVLVWAIKSCMMGKGNNEIYILAEKRERKTIKKCNIRLTHILNRRKIGEVFKKVMKAENKSEICIRNNDILNAVVCKDFHKGLSEENIANASKITIEDVKYITSKCPSKPINQNVEQSVCIDKSVGKSLTDILVTYSSYNKDSINTTYRNCNLTSFQKKAICDSKNRGYNRTYVVELFKHYKEGMVISIFDQCTVQMRPAQVAYICIISKRFKTTNPKHKRFSKLANKYGMKAVGDVLKKRCKHFGKV